MNSIYAASSWKNIYQPHVVTTLRANSFEVYDFRNPPNRTGFAWSQIDPKWEEWTTQQYMQALSHPIAVAGFQSDYLAMQESDICVLVLPCGNSAHIEAGTMAGWGRPTFVLAPEAHTKPDLMYRICDGIFTELSDLTLALRDFREDWTRGEDMSRDEIERATGEIHQGPLSAPGEQKGN